MLYTGKGDNGTTKLFGCDGRVSKSSAVAEALGSLDEINSLLGFCKVKARGVIFKLGERCLALDIVLGEVQQNLFTIQAELAGSDKRLVRVKVTDMEEIIGDIEKALPPIKSFFVSGGTELASLIDFSRTVARRAERRVVAAKEESNAVLSENSLAYLNRLSSLLYALARLINHKSGITEERPSYN